jgi:hypothetical protein
MESDQTSAFAAAEGSRAVPQPVSAPLTRAAIFLVVTVNPGPDDRGKKPMWQTARFPVWEYI